MNVLSEIENTKIVQANDLITSVAKMDKIPLKFFEIAVASIDVNDVPKDRTVYISKKLLFSYFNVKSEAKHSRFKQALLNLHTQAIFQIREQVSEGKFEMTIISPIEESKWNNYNDEVSIQFTSKIMPFLIDLKENFTQYLLSDISNLNSKYSIILYKWLCMNFNQYEHYQYKGNRTQQQLNKYRNPIIKIDDLRGITNTQNEYKKMHQFTEWVLDKPIKEITEKTHYNVSYEKIKEGRSIAAIQFFISKKKVAGENYKENDITYIKDKAMKLDADKELYLLAQQSKYTQLLIKYIVIGVQDILDMEVMISLQKNVYPLYEELEVLRGIDGVENHIEYVRNKMQGYSKRNIAKYLKKSVDDYLVKVKIQNID